MTSAVQLRIVLLWINFVPLSSFQTGRYYLAVILFETNHLGREYCLLLLRHSSSQPIPHHLLLLHPPPLSRLTPPILSVQPNPPLQTVNIWWRETLSLLERNTKSDTGGSKLSSPISIGLDPHIQRIWGTSCKCASRPLLNGSYSSSHAHSKEVVMHICKTYLKLRDRVICGRWPIVMNGVISDCMPPVSSISCCSFQQW